VLSLTNRLSTTSWRPFCQQFLSEVALEAVSDFVYPDMTLSKKEKLRFSFLVWTFEVEPMAKHIHEQKILQILFLAVAGRGLRNRLSIISRTLKLTWFDISQDEMRRRLFKKHFLRIS